MSKVLLVITVVVGRSQREVARAYGVSQGWVSFAAMEPRVCSEKSKIFIPK
jgi:hypothetical protein